MLLNGGVALNKALCNYMYSIGPDEDVLSWFSTRVQKKFALRNLIAKALRTSA